MMRAENLKITFNPGTPIENPALRGMSLSIADGEFVTVIGSNGAGKSTFLNAISGDLAVDSGIICIDNQDVTRLPAHKRAHLVIDQTKKLQRDLIARNRNTNTIGNTLYSSVILILIETAKQISQCALKLPK